MPKMNNIVPVVLVKNDCYWLPYVLEAVRGRFNRYVIYDVGSSDGTLDVIDWFRSSEDADFFIRKLPDCPPAVQGAFRNSMFAETKSDWIFMLDGDELYSPTDLDNFEFWWNSPHENFRKCKYGIFERVEFAQNLKQVYEQRRSHHRIYHRTAIFRGPHPGEYPDIEQKPENERWVIWKEQKITCYHMHNTLRSTKEEETQKRIERKNKPTYHPGDTLVDFDLLSALPLLQKPIENFPVSPQLAELQKEYVPV